MDQRSEEETMAPESVDFRLMGLFQDMLRKDPSARDNLAKIFQEANTERSGVDTNSPDNSSISDHVLSPSSSCPVRSIAPPKDGFVCEKFTIEDKDQNKLYTYYFYRSNNHKNHPFPTEYNSLDKEEFNRARKAYERFKKRDAKQAAGYTTKKRGREVREGDDEGQGRLKRSKQDEEEDERVNLLERALIDESMEVATSQTEVRLLKNQLADVRQLLETKKQAATKVRKAREILSKDPSLTTSFGSDLFLLFFRRASFTAISSIKNEVGFDVDPKTVYKNPRMRGKIVFGIAGQNHVEDLVF